MLFDLPKSLDVGGKSWDIRTDYRDILTIIQAIDDPNLENNEKIYVCMTGVYYDFEDMPQSLYEEAYKAAMSFISHGNDDDKKTSKKNMDWEQDAPLLFPAVNHVAGFEVRSVEYMHWWEFLTLFQGLMMSDSTSVNFVVGTRQTKIKSNMPKEEKKRIQRLQKDFALPASESEQKAKDNLTNVLSKMAQKNKKNKKSEENQ